MQTRSFLLGSILAATGGIFILGGENALLAAGAPTSQPEAAAQPTAPTRVKEHKAKVAPAHADSPPPSKQLVVVTSDSWNSHRGTLQTFQAFEDHEWQEWGDETPVSLGRQGMAWGRGLMDPPKGARRKVEGDGRSPAGIFSLGTAFGNAKALPESEHHYPYLQVEKTTYCVEDLRSPHYNQIIDLGDIDARIWRKRSPLLRPDGLFRWGVVVGQNDAPPAPGAGSCIFLHVWRGAAIGTAGCTAMPEPYIVKLVSWLDARAETRLVQLPREAYENLREAQRLPVLR